MHPIIENNKNQIAALCRKHFVKELYAFGSVTRNDFQNDSDIDFLYRFYENDIPEKDYADNFFTFKEEIQSTLKRDVDLIAYDFLKNPYFIKIVEKEKEKIYG